MAITSFHATQARIQKCGLGVECRRHSNGGAEGLDGVGSGENGAVPPPQKTAPPRKILAFSPSKWCILMHSGARFRLFWVVGSTPVTPSEYGPDATHGTRRGRGMVVLDSPLGLESKKS